MVSSRLDRIRLAFEQSIALKMDLLAGDQLVQIAEMATCVTRSLERGGKLLLCGNGGSAADAQHLAAELLVRLNPSHCRRPLPALSLALDTSSITACANDYAFDEVFERLFVALHRPEDVLLGISTSGKSPNVVKALRAARTRGVTTMGFLGGEGGPASLVCDHTFVVPSFDTARIQECHITAGHVMLDLVERELT